MRIFLTVAILAAVAAGCGSGFGDGRGDFDASSSGERDTGVTPIDEDIRDGRSEFDASGRNQTDAATTDTSSVDWPPAVSPTTGAATFDEAGATEALLGAEATLTIPAGALTEETVVDVTRALVDVQGVELVGYIWGPHGMPIDPPATLTVEVDTSWIPPGIAPIDARLLFWDKDKQEATELPDGKAIVNGSRVTMTAPLTELGVIAIGPIPTP